MSTPKKPGPKNPGATIRLTFDDGSTGSLTWEEYERHRITEFSRAANSEDPKLRLKGQQALADVAKLVARSRIGHFNQKSGGVKGGRVSTKTRVRAAVDPAAVVRAAEKIGWPATVKDVYKTVAKSFDVTSDRIGQILRKKIEERNSTKRS